MSDIGVEIGGEVTGFRRAMQEMVNSARDGTKGIESQFGSLGTVFKGVQSHIAAIGAAFAGIGVAGFVKQSIDAADHLHDLSQRMGVSVEMLSGLRLAAEQSGISLETIAVASKKLSVNMTEAAAGNKEMNKIFGDLGLSGSNATEVMVKLADIFSRMPDGPLKTALAVKLLGKAGDEMIPLLNGGSAALLTMIERGVKFSGVTNEMGNQADQFNDEMAALKLNISGIFMSLGKDLLPVLNSMMGYMQKAAGRTRDLSSEFNPLKETFRALIVLGGNVAFTFRAVGREIGGIAAQVSALATGNFSAFSAIGKAMKEDAAAARKEFDEWEKRMMSPNFGIPPAAAAPEGGNGGDSDTEARVCRAMGGRWNSKTKKCESSSAASDHKAEGHDSYMPYYEGALEEEKRLAYERDALRGYTKQEELSFWQFLLANAEVKSKDHLAIERKISGLIVEIKRTEAKQRQELDGEGIRSGEALALGRVEAERAAAQVSLDLGTMAKAQFLALEENFEQQRFEIQRTALEQRMQLLEKDPTTNPVEFARVKNQILELEQQHELKRIQIQGKIAQDSGQIWIDLRDRMGGLWDQGMQAMLNGTLTWRNAMRAVGTQVVAWFATDVVGKQVKTWLLGETAKTGATQTGTAIRLALESGAALKSIGIGALAAIKKILNAAAETFAGIFAFLSPEMGPWAAIPAAAGAGAVAAMTGKVMSASGGYDIPRGINPLTQLHEQEMVLPAKHANVIRDIAEGGGAAGGGVSSLLNLSSKHVYRNKGKALMVEAN